MKPVLLLLVGYLALSVPYLVWAEAPLPPPPAAPVPVLDPVSICEMDRVVGEYMVANQPLGHSAADLGNFLGSGGGQILLGLGTWAYGDHISPEFSGEMARGYGTCAALTYLTKRLVGRERPDGSTHTSWPSGHTSSTVAAMTVISHHMDGGWEQRLPLMALGATVALSRVQHNRHWFSDTVAGAVLGYASGRQACGELSAGELALTAGLIMAVGRRVVRAEAAATANAAGQDKAPRRGLSFMARPNADPALVLWRTDF